MEFRERTNNLKSGKSQAEQVKLECKWEEIAMKKRAGYLFIALVLLFTTLLAGCGSSSSADDNTANNTANNTEEAVQSDDTETVSAETPSDDAAALAEHRKQLTGTLNIWMRAGEGEGGKPGDPFYDYVQSVFPNLVLNISPDKDWKDITAGLASGDLPDIFFWEGPIPAILETINQNGYAEPLDSYLEKDPEFKNSFIPSLLDQHKVDGVTYGIPFDPMPVAVVANLDLFDEANVPYPSDDWTIDDFIDTAKKLTNKSDPQNMKTGLARNIDVEDYPRILNFFLQAYGVQGYKEVDGKKVSNLAEDPNAITAIEKYLEAYGNNYATTLSEDEKKAMGLDTSVWDVDWQKGVAAMFVASSWAVPYDQASQTYPFKVGVFNVPQGPGGRGTLIGEIGYSIYKGSKNKDLAWEYLKFMTSQEFRDNAYVTDPDTGEQVKPFKYDENRYSFSSVIGQWYFGYGVTPFATEYSLNDEFTALYTGFQAASQNTNNSYITPDLLKLTQEVNSGKKQLVDGLKEYDNLVNANKVLENPPIW
jgi:ABC-type glycerol-3-phosphate transport system substrate-binding protein